MHTQSHSRSLNKKLYSARMHPCLLLTKKGTRLLKGGREKGAISNYVHFTQNIIPPPSNLIVDVMYVRESEKENMRLRQRNHTFKCNPRPSLQTRRCRGKEGERHVRAAEPQSNKKYPPSLRKLRQTPLLSKTWVPGRGRANRLSPFVPRPPPLPRPEVSEASL